MPAPLSLSAVSLTVQHQLDRTQQSLGTRVQRLSSGLRINSAKDDAAGLAIAERMAGQLRGASQALRNTSDAVSLFQTTDGFLGQISSALQRVRELAVQSANGTNSTSDRSALNQEAQQALAEIDRRATSAAFNGQKLLDGSLGSAGFQVGANSADRVELNPGQNSRIAALGALQWATSSDLRVVNAGTGGAFAFAGTYTTAPIANLDFSVAAVSFVGGSTTSAGTPATDYSAGQSAVFTVDGSSVTLNANYGSLAGVTGAIQSQLSAAHPGWYGVTNNGASISIQKTSGAASATAAVAVGLVSGANAAVFAGGAGSTGTAAVATTHAGMQVDGHAVAITTDYSGNATGLIADIQGQLNAAPGGAGTYVVSGSAAGISINRTGSTSTPVVGGFTGAGASAFGPAPLATLLLAAGDFSVQLGNRAAVDILGSFPTAQSLADAVAAQIPGMFASINTSTGALELMATDPFTLGGVQAAPTGVLAFTQLSSAQNGSLQTANLLDFGNATTMLVRVDAALSSINAHRATLGALLNRFDQVVSNLQTGGENLAAARGRIMDTDFATETASLASNQVLVQSEIAMVAQANLASRNVLALLSR